MERMLLAFLDRRRSAHRPRYGIVTVRIYPGTRWAAAR